MSLLIYRKELRSLSRDRRTVLLVGIVGVLLLTTLIVSYSQYVVLAQERTTLENQMRHKWTHQTDKNAHGAAHYGTYVFTPRPVLSFFDAGISDYVGGIIRVTAHSQNEALFSAAGDSSGGVRFGTLSLALVLQMLIPLLLIFLAFDAVTGERSAATFRLLLTQGASTGRILWQKIAAYYTLALGLLAFVLLLTAGLTVILAGVAGASNEPVADLGGRLLGIGLSYGSYYFIILAGAVGLSALSRSGTQSLLTLLGVWFVATVLLPKWAANFGDNRYPLPTKQAFLAAIDRDMHEGVNGHDPDNVRNDRFVKSLLLRYRVDSVSQLPINADGMLMQADEEYRATVTKKHFGTVYGQIQRQNQVSALISWLDPFLSIRELSMSLSGTDYRHQVHFEEQVQAYKLALVERLNTYMTTHSRTGDWTTPAERWVFSQTPEFRYAPPRVGWSLAGNGLVMLSLLTWLAASVFWVNWAAKRTAPL